VDGWRSFPYVYTPVYAATTRVLTGNPWQDCSDHTWFSTGKMYSQGHPFHLRKKGDQRDLGGPWHLENWKRTFAPGYAPTYPDTSGYPNRLYRGYWGWNIIGSGTATNFWSLPTPASTFVLDATGASGIAQADPLKSSVDLGVTFAELAREGIRIPGYALKFAKDTWESGLKRAADEYLNVAFGLAPLLSDLKQFWDTTRNFNNLLQQFARDSGRTVRRKWGWPPVEARRQWKDVGKRTLGPSARYSITYDVIERSTTWKSFSGAFVYNLPVDKTVMSSLDNLRRKADRLYGLNPDIETLWNLAPWSWALDWFTNAGDVIHNINAFKTQGLVMRYGYVMYEQSYETEIVMSSTNPASFSATNCYDHIGFSISSGEKRIPTGSVWMTRHSILTNMASLPR